MRAPSGLRAQLLRALVLPAIGVLAAMGYFADQAVSRALDDSLGERLMVVGRSAAAVVEPRVVLMERGDDDLRIARRTRKSLADLGQEVGVDRILIIKLKDATILVDSTEKLRAGDDYLRAALDEDELARVAAGDSAASVLFRGVEGRWYKTGYAPLADGDQAAEAAVVVNARADFFGLIDEVRVTLALATVVGLLALVALAFFAARRVTVPLQRLSRAAEHIGGGDLETEIPVGGPEETVVLSETMRAMQKSLRDRDEEMQLMLAGIAHEVRNPLGGIELFGSLLREDLEGDEEKTSHVNKILKEINVLAGVVNDFLAFARKHPLEKKNTRVYALLREVVSMSAQQAQEAKVDLELDVSAELHALLDPQALHRTLLNLVRNGIQATPEGGVVTLRAQDAAGTLILIVEDTGDGIPEDKRAEIFTPFVTTKQKGTGLGLALVKKAIDAHDGTIEVSSTEGGGARFAILLPDAVRPAPEPSEEPGLLG